MNFLVGRILKALEQGNSENNNISKSGSKSDRKKENT
jgi:hypothetical protein